MRGARDADHHDVRALAGLQRADAVLHPQRPRAAEGRHLQHRRRRARRWDRRWRAWPGGRPSASPRTCRGRCCWPRRRCRGPRRRPSSSISPHRAPRPRRASCCSAGSGRRPTSAALQDARGRSAVSQMPCAPSTPLRRKPEVAQVLGGRLAVALRAPSSARPALSERWMRMRRAVPVGQRARGLAASPGLAR